MMQRVFIAIGDDNEGESTARHSHDEAANLSIAKAAAPYSGSAVVDLTFFSGISVITLLTPTSRVRCCIWKRW